MSNKISLLMVAVALSLVGGLAARADDNKPAGAAKGAAVGAAAGHEMGSGHAVAGAGAGAAIGHHQTKKAEEGKEKEK